MSAVRRASLRAARSGPGDLLLRVLDRLMPAAPGSFAVLTYHRVDHPGAKPWLYPPLLSATPASFEAQMEMVRRRYRPVSVEELLASYDGSRPLPPRCVLVTFDDAYQSFAENAWPILRRLGIPATLFVPTGFPDCAVASFWWDRVYASIMLTADLRPVAKEIGLEPTASPARRERAAMSLVEQCKSMPHHEALTTVKEICDRLGRTEFASDILGWGDLRELARDGVHLAPHSRSHPLLTKISAEEVHAEMSGSQTDLSRQIQGGAASVVNDVFAYPAGDYDPVVVRLARATGFKVAFTTKRGTNRLGRTDPLRLRRINVSSRATPSVIRGEFAIGALIEQVAG